MSLTAILTALAALLSTVVALFREHQARQDGAAAQLQKSTQETIHEISAATIASDAVARDLQLHPDLVRAPDRFQRPD